MEASSWLHTPAALHPGEQPWISIEEEAQLIQQLLWTLLRTKKILSAEK